MSRILQLPQSRHDERGDNHDRAADDDDDNDDDDDDDDDGDDDDDSDAHAFAAHNDGGLNKSIWECLLEQNAIALGQLLSVYSRQGCLNTLLCQRVEELPGEFAARCDYQELHEEGFGDGSGRDVRTQVPLDRRWFVYAGGARKHGSKQFRTFVAGSTPLHVALRWSENATFDRLVLEPTACVQLLLRHGASVHAVDADSQTPLSTLIRGQSPSFLFDDSRICFVSLVDSLCRRGSHIGALSKERLALSNVLLVGFLKLALLLASDSNVDSPINERLIQSALGAIQTLAEHGAVFDVDSVQHSLFPNLHALSAQDRHTISEWARQSVQAADTGYKRRHSHISSLRTEIQSLPPAAIRSRHNNAFGDRRLCLANSTAILAKSIPPRAGVHRSPSPQKSKSAAAAAAAQPTNVSYARGSTSVMGVVRK